MIILFYIWAAATVYLIGFYGYFHWRLVFYKPPPAPNFDKPVSVIICARNEAANLQKNLPKILSQKNVHFEVVVVNDRSTDGTAEVLKLFKGQYPNLKIVASGVEEDYIGKKKALGQGIANADFDYFILTDADCAPVSGQWLSSMASGFADYEIVLGVSPHRTPHNFIGKITGWETLQTAQNYLSLALAGLPYMGVGRNLGYSRKIFDESDGFSSHLQIPSGDDDLFISKISNPENTTINLHPEAFTWSAGPKDLKTWWRQKRRHLSTASKIRPWPSFLLGMLGLSQLIFYATLVPMVIYLGLEPHVQLSVLAGGLVVIKFFQQWLSLKSVAGSVYANGSLGFFPFWEFLVVVFLAIIHLQNQIAVRPQKWS